VRVPPQTIQTLKPGAHPIQFKISTVGDESSTLVEKSTFVVPR
jgi:hypothetical protein